MRIHLIAVGHKMPDWVVKGYLEYAKRLPSDCPLQLHEIPAQKRAKGADLKRIADQEGQRMLDAVPKGAWVIALDEQGVSWATSKLAGQLSAWQQQGRDIALLVGGPEGLSSMCRKRADQIWSLSGLTLPHPLVRVIVAEQLYRAWSINNNHPYHRA